MRWFVFCFLLLAPVLARAEEAAAPAQPTEPTPPTNSTEAAPPPEKKEADMDKFAQLMKQGFERDNAGSYAEAVDFYTQALAVEPESPVALIQRGICFIKLRVNDKGLDDLRAAVELSPRTVSDYAALSWLRSTAPLLRFRDGSVAVAYAQKALHASESADNYDLLAAGYAEMGNFSQASNTLARAIKLFPDSPHLAAMKERLALYRQKKKYAQDWNLAPES
ncbi:MAG: tetratricopeptide repeat protein [bacterium]